MLGNQQIIKNRVFKNLKIFSLNIFKLIKKLHLTFFENVTVQFVADMSLGFMLIKKV